jgi:hypothetical protein
MLKNVNFKFQPPTMFPFFFFTKVVSLNYSSSEDLSQNNPTRWTRSSKQAPLVHQRWTNVILYGIDRNVAVEYQSKETHIHTVIIFICELWLSQYYEVK